MKLVPAFGFTFAAVVLGDAAQLLQALKIKGLDFPSLSFFNAQIQTLDMNGKVLHGRSSKGRLLREGLSNRARLLCSCLLDGPSAAHSLLELPSLSGAPSTPPFALGRQCVLPLILYQFYQRKTGNK